MALDLEIKNIEAEFKKFNQLESKLNKEEIELMIERDKYDRIKTDLTETLLETEKIENRVLGNSKIDTILNLINEIKDSIDIVNHIQQKILEKYQTIYLNPIQKKVLSDFGIYDLTIRQPKVCQAKVILILKLLSELIENESDKPKKEESYKTKKEESYNPTKPNDRSYLIAKGLLKTLHFRINYFQSTFLTFSEHPIEVQRLFTKLEPEISNLAHLDDKNVKTLDYKETIDKFFKLSLEEQCDFVKKYYSVMILDSLSEPTKTTILISLLSTNSISPESIINQIKRWDQINQTFRNKMIQYLKISLTQYEKLRLINDQIKKIKEESIE